MKAYERLLKYVVVRTPSDENSDTVPSSTCQFDLARILETEMKELGLVMNITDLGVTEAMIDGLVQSTIILPGGYKTLTPEEITTIFKQSM